jgi:hypothetical protein
LGLAKALGRQGVQNCNQGSMRPVTMEINKWSGQVTDGMRVLIGSSFGFFVVHFWTIFGPFSGFLLRQKKKKKN